jgi:hypothetical protein
VGIQKEAPLSIYDKILEARKLDKKSQVIKNMY